LLGGQPAHRGDLVEPLELLAREVVEVDVDGHPLRLRPLRHRHVSHDLTGTPRRCVRRALEAVLVDRDDGVAGQVVRVDARLAG
jgi:hypothetical protein